MATIYRILRGRASLGPPTIQCRGFMLLQETDLSGTTIPGGTTETNVSHLFYLSWVGRKGDQTGNQVIGTVVLPKLPGGKPYGTTIILVAV